ncbi:SDR family NAD(P)-dependent oxidoreductase [Mycobacteroides salmoniphilum]|uniref:SDR family NAD(P)-dependent oxidoreductase n=1 Tax=Mycobacteroides salmoniphilum TaxID=404941 RepID=UPI0009934568|nr:SDR family NAD(P)-dependent oxidoreductase [Mycobacteroides salmoniphilum]QCH26328.1 Fatty acyl-CoA reductase [Mycobacteroides salmoniphilum]
MSVRRTVQELAQRRTLLPARIDSLLSGPGRDVSQLTVVVTGASAGIGRQAVIQLRARGARVIGVARRADELQTLAAETGCDWRTCDLTDQTEIERLLQDLDDQHVDVLVNNAGRSIRRLIVDATDRLHDYQRTMALNYFAPVQLTLGLMPGMIERGRGQFVNVSTWALHANTFPRFSAYAASKSALAIFGRTLNAERPHPGVHATNVHFPLVRTEMITPTAEYDGATALSAQEAGRWIVRAITHQPVEVNPAVLRALLPAIDLFSPTASDSTIASIT